MNGPTLRTAFPFDPSELKILEIYRSIQGEGIDIGREVVFVRTSGCNLSCVWCDTKVTWTGMKGESLPPVEVVRRVVQETKGSKAIVITGGEPLVQPLEPMVQFVGALFDLGYTIAWESNGLIVADDRLIEYSDLFTISPKLASSGQVPFPPSTLDMWAARAEGKLQVKFVISDEADMKEAVFLISEAPNLLETGTPIVFQPEHSKDKDIYVKLPDMARDAFRERGLPIMSYDIRYIPQTHKHYQIR